MPPIDELKTLIVSELKLGEFAAAQQDEIVQGVAENVFHALMGAVLERLPDDSAQEKFTQMAEAGDMTALKAFARTQIEGFDALMASEVRKEIEAHKS